MCECKMWKASFEVGVSNVQVKRYDVIAGSRQGKVEIIWLLLFGDLLRFTSDT